MTVNPDHLLADAIGRIWAQISANSANIGDMFERIAQSFYGKVVGKGDLVIDGGAHSGRHTLPLARLVGDTGLVVAFEPLPSAAETLTRMLADSGLSGRVRLRPEAIARDRGRQTFFVVNNMPEFSGLRSREYVGFVPEHTEIQVDVNTIDEALASMSSMPGASRVAFIKLDLEGGEFHALQGARRTLERDQPPVVFENGLQASASGYDAEEFFGYFASIGYELYDILGCRVHEVRWSQSGPWYFVAIPQAQSHRVVPLLWASSLEELLMVPWLPTGQLRLPSSTFALVDAATNPGVIGHIDRVESTVAISGWAGDLVTGSPARSIVVSADGVALASYQPGQQRYDVMAATGQVGFAHAGFELAVRAPRGGRIEVHAEAADGSYVTLPGSDR